MTAEAPSTVSADESQQSVVGAGERSAGEGPSGEVGSFPALPHRTAGSPNGNGTHPHVTDDRAATDDHPTANDRAGAEGPTMNGRMTAKSPATADDAANSAVTEDATAEDATAEDATAEDATADPVATDDAMDAVATDADVTDADATDADATDNATDGRAKAADRATATDGAATDGRAKAADRGADEQSAAGGRPKASGRAATRPRPAAADDTPADDSTVDSADDQATPDDRAAEPATADRAAESDTENSHTESSGTENGASVTDADTVDASPDADDPSASVDTEPMEYAGEGGVRMDTAVQEVVEAVADDPWIRTADEKAIAEEVLEEAFEDDLVAGEVAHQLEAVVGEDPDADPAEFAAAAVLDVLRASGWADVAEATELRAESARLRELLAEVIRDHRAREASMAGTENQQLHWLVPLLRAAHGVAFGSLGAKVALRTAVQDVPPEVLASAGLRIDYGVTHDYEDDRQGGERHA